MTYTEVSSSTIDSVSYDESERLFYVRFRNGGEFVYATVPVRTG